MYKYIPIILLLLSVISCSRTPDNVISESEMVNLLTDIHKGEAYEELNSDRYYNDSLKKLLKQSIFAKHGVSEAEFDSSIVWYGKHIDEYVKVYDEVIKKLQNEDKDIIAESKKAGESLPAGTGDSVNLWVKKDIRIFAKGQSDSILSFDIKSDTNFKRGDLYIWQYRLMSIGMPISVMLAVDYTDGTTAYMYNKDSFEGWNKIKLQSDTSKTVKRIYGTATAQTSKTNIAYIDSIGLIRTRLDKYKYYYMYQQKIHANKSLLKH